MATVSHLIAAVLMKIPSCRCAMKYLHIVVFAVTLVLASNPRTSAIYRPMARGIRRSGPPCRTEPADTAIRGLELGDDPVRIGRLPDCAIALSDSQVSRHHAEIRKAEKGYAVFDLESLNGTTVNGAVVREHALADGDVISVGETAIRYEES